MSRPRISRREENWLLVAMAVVIVAQTGLVFADLLT